MKLRKKAGALLDLPDDPSDVDTESEYHSSEGESEDLDETLWDIVEEDEDGSEDKGEPDGSGEEDTDPLSSSDGDLEGELAEEAEDAPSAGTVHSEPDGHGSDIEEEDDEPPGTPSFNPFALLADEPEEQDSDASSDGAPGAAASRGASTSDAASRRRRRHRQRRRQRGRQRQPPTGPVLLTEEHVGEPAPFSGEPPNQELPSALPETYPPALTVDGLGTEVSEGGEPGPAAEASFLTPGAEYWAASSGDEASGEEEGQDGDSDGGESAMEECWLCYGEGRIVHSDAAGSKGCEGCRGDTTATAGGAAPGGCGPAALGASQAAVTAAAAAGAARACCGCGSSSNAGAEHVCGQGSTGCAHRSCGGGECSGSCGGEERAADELVAPCKVCAGGLRYIHRRCFARWLESSWAIACPNCRTLYDSAVLDAHTEGPSVRSMLLSSIPSGHDPREPFPPLSQVLFCVANTVELSMACGGVTAVGVLRRIRMMVDDMAAHGGDGGLGLVREDGSVLELPNFTVTSLVLVVPDEAARGGSNGGPQAVRNYRTFLEELFYDGMGEYDDNGYYSDNDYDDEAEETDASGARPRPPMDRAPWQAEDYVSRRNTDATSTLANATSELLRRQRLAPVSLREPSFSRSAGLPLNIALMAHQRAWSATESLFDGSPWPHRPGGATPPTDMARVEVPVDLLFPGTRHDRAVQRAEQQRRRAELQAQQRVQQRYTSGSRGQHVSSGPPRRSGGRRR